jgi:hypothetical protein
MGLMQKLRDWWSLAEPINREELDADFDEYKREMRSENRFQNTRWLKDTKPRIEEFVRIAFSHIEPETLGRLIKRVHKALGTSTGNVHSESDALRHGLMGDFFRGRRVPYAFGCEARYFEEEAVACLNKLLNTNGIHDVFDYVSPNDLSVPAHLLEKFSQFLESIDWKCVGLDTGGDEYVVFVTRGSSYQALVEAANQANISITDKPYLM